jgi:hypothetical protein
MTVETKTADLQTTVSADCGLSLVIVIYDVKYKNQIKQYKVFDYKLEGSGQI